MAALTSNFHMTWNEALDLYPDEIEELFSWLEEQRSKE